MVEAKKAAAPTVSTKDTAPLKGQHVTVSEANMHDATGRPANYVPPKDIDPNAPVNVKVVENTPEEDENPPYSTRLGHLTDEEQVATYGHVLQPEKPFVSEGMRHDLITYGYAVDPASGKRVELA